MCEPKHPLKFQVGVKYFKVLHTHIYIYIYMCVNMCTACCDLLRSYGVCKCHYEGQMVRMKSLYF